MAKRKSFEAYVPEDPDVAFDVGGVEFRCVPMVSGQAILDFTTQLDEDKPAQMAGALTAFMKLAIAPEEWDRWQEFASDPTNGVTMEILAEIAGWLAEEYVGRPLSQSSSSLVGAVPVGPLRPAKPVSQA